MASGNVAISRIRIRHQVLDYVDNNRAAHIPSLFKHGNADKARAPTKCLSLSMFQKLVLKNIAYFSTITTVTLY